jgi:hypothetical protein
MKFITVASMFRFIAVLNILNLDPVLADEAFVGDSKLVFRCYEADHGLVLNVSKSVAGMSAKLVSVSFGGGEELASFTGISHKICKECFLPTISFGGVDLDNEATFILGVVDDKTGDGSSLNWRGNLNAIVQGGFVQKSLVCQKFSDL